MTTPRLLQAMEAFLAHRLGAGGTLKSLGSRLCSYNVVIAEWYWGTIIIRGADPGGVETRTTRRHKGMLRDMATARGIQVIEARWS